jgi:Leucine-rich repeat (LRR) protein
MKFNNILKSVTLALSIPFVFADQKEMTGDCKEIVDFFTEKNVLSSIPKCEVDNNGNVVSIELNSYYITEECVKKALSYNTITNLTYTKVGATPSHNPVYNIFPPEIANLTNLEEFIFSFSGYRSYAKTSIPAGSLKLSKTLKKLIIAGITATQSNIDDIATLTNLEYLKLNYFNRPSEEFSYEPLKILHNISFLELDNEGYFLLEDIPKVAYESYEVLNHLAIHGHGLDYISKYMAYLKNLKYLDLSGNNIKYILGRLNNHEKLEYVDLSRNAIYEDIPEFFNNYKNLKYINLSENQDIRGKTINNPNLETCIYDNKYENLCITDKSIKCLKDNSYSYNLCKTDNDNDLPYTTNGQCNSKDGKCQPGQCCSKHGWCGTGDMYCGSGCQKEFGNCN